MRNVLEKTKYNDKRIEKRCKRHYETLIGLLCKLGNRCQSIKNE